MIAPRNRPRKQGAAEDGAPFGSGLRIAREARGWSQRDLARESGVSQPHISGIEGGTREASTRVLRRLASALDVSISNLFEEAAA